jgi:hypothetical protein
MRSLLVLALLAAVSAPLHAQRRDRNGRHGFWAGAGLAAGSIGVNCSGCTNDRVNGPAGYVRLGGTLSHKLLLGGEAAGWSMTALGVDQRVGALMLDLFWYPGRTSPFFLTFGIGGLGYDRQSTVLGATNETVENAGAVTLGLGYDVRIGRNVSIVPFANAYGSSAVKRKVNGTEVITNGDVRRDMVQLGVGITLH